MKTYIKKNGMRRVIIIGVHPMKDWVAIGSGIENDICFVSFAWFYENFVEENGEGE